MKIQENKLDCPLYREHFVQERDHKIYCEWKMATLKTSYKSTLSEYTQQRADFLYDGVKVNTEKYIDFVLRTY